MHAFSPPSHIPDHITSPFSPSHSHPSLYTSKLALSHEIHGHDGCINALDFSKDGELLCTGSDDATIRLWNVLEPKNCHELNCIRGHKTNIFAVKFLNDSRESIVSGGNDADVRLYDLEKDKMCTVFEHHTRKVLCIKDNILMPHCFLSCSADGTVRLFDVRCHYNNTRRETLQEANSVMNAGVGDVSSFEDGGVLPQSLGGGRAERRSATASSPRESLVMKLPSTAYTVDWHPMNSHDYLVTCDDGNTYLFDLRKSEATDYTKAYTNLFLNANHRCDVTGASFDYCGRKIITTCIRGNIFMYDAEKNFEKDHGLNFLEYDVKNDENIQTYEREFKGHASYETIKGVWFWGPNSEYVISGSDEGTIFIWDRETGKIVRILEGHQGNVNNLAFHPSLPMFASSGIDSHANVWEPKDEEISHEEMERRESLIKEAEEREFNEAPDFADIGGGGEMFLLQLIMMMNRARAARIARGEPASSSDDEDEDLGDDDDDSEEMHDEDD